MNKWQMMQNCSIDTIPIWENLKHKTCLTNTNNTEVCTEFYEPMKFTDLARRTLICWTTCMC